MPCHATQRHQRRNKGASLPIRGRKERKKSHKLIPKQYTPSTKAPAGEKDENISPGQAVKIVGEKYAARIAELSLSVYSAAAAYARERGIIVADTKL